MNVNHRTLRCPICFTSSAKIIKGYNFKTLGYSYRGSMLVLKNILNSEYLWSQVRIKGGAYGSAISISPSGNIFLYSYRDPNLKETLKVFDNSNIYLKNFKPSDTEMKNYIIGTIGNLDSPLDPCDKGRTADINYIIKKTQKDIQNERTQVLLTKKEDIVNYSDLLKKITEKNYLCVIGNRQKIISNKNLFSSVKNIITK